MATAASGCHKRSLQPLHHMVLASRLLFTAAVLLVGYLSLRVIWTREVDLSLVAEKIAEYLPTRKHPFKADITYGNLMLVSIQTKNSSHHLNGRLALLVYALNIVNTSGGNAALKEARLQYRDAKNSGDVGSIDLEASPICDEDGMVLPAIVVRKYSDYIFVGDWKNLQSELQLKQSKQDGDVWSGSVCFVFPKNVSDPRSITGMTLVLSDFLGNNVEVPLPAKDVNARASNELGRLWYGKVVKTADGVHWAD